MSDEKTSLLDEVRAAAAEVGMAPDTPIGIEPPEPKEPAEAPAGETAEQKADRERDEKGRFAKEGEGKPRETLKLKEKQPTAPAPSGPETTGTKPAEGVAAPAGQAAPKTADEPIAPPAEWKGAGKVQWNKLPKAIQQEMRETYESVAAAKAEFEPLSRAIAPHRDVLIRDAGSVESGIGQLMQFYNAYLTNPQALIHHIARTRGIDLGTPQGQPQQGTQQQPDINSLIAQSVQQAIAPIQERFQQTESQQTEQAISAFQADPAHPYFNDVRVHMGQILKAGAAKDLQDAYDQATWANPVIRQQLLAAQAEETAKTQAAQAATARKAAAASLTGAPIAGAGAPEGRASKTESARDTVLKVYREQMGA
jgi:hypothetical protein